MASVGRLVFHAPVHFLALTICSHAFADRKLVFTLKGDNICQKTLYAPRSWALPFAPSLEYMNPHAVLRKLVVKRFRTSGHGPLAALASVLADQV
jgi:hypothetical protein